MYNRYIPSNEHNYIPIPESETCDQTLPKAEKSAFFSSILQRLKPERLDKGDLLLAAVLLLIYLDSEEEEYLFAMILLFLL